MSKKDLYNEEAKEKIKELAESIDFTMLCSNLSAKPFHAVPMSTKKVDDEGNVWFLSGKDSEHNQHITRHRDVQLLYSDPGSVQFLTIYGTAAIHTEKSVLRDLYVASDDSWFDGVDDPNLTAIKVSPQEAHYWDVKGNKLVALFKMSVSAITGDKPDLAEHGNLRV